RKVAGHGHRDVAGDSLLDGGTRRDPGGTVDGSRDGIRGERRGKADRVLAGDRHRRGDQSPPGGSGPFGGGWRVAARGSRRAGGADPMNRTELYGIPLEVAGFTEQGPRRENQD